MWNNIQQELDNFQLKYRSTLFKDHPALNDKPQDITFSYSYLIMLTCKKYDNMLPSEFDKIPDSDKAKMIAFTLAQKQLDRIVNWEHSRRKERKRRW